LDAYGWALIRRNPAAEELFEPSRTVLPVLIKFMIDCQAVGFRRLAFHSTLYVSPGIGAKSSVTPPVRLAELNLRPGTALVE
jgi:hypothetical protein